MRKAAMLSAIRADLAIIKERDPACRGTLEILLCYPGFHALVLHRLSHRLWQLELPLPARLLSQLSRGRQQQNRCIGHP